MRRGPLVILLALAPAWAGDAPTLRVPLPFSHDTHARTFDRAEVWCTDCHPVRGAPGALPVPTATCHGCHVDDVVPGVHGAPGTCETCHAVRRELVPVTHDLGWIERHGAPASRLRSDCADCHEASQCLDCHERRGAGTRSPHGPGFRTLHGVEARLDAASCAECHSSETCTSCHAKGGAPW